MKLTARATMLLLLTVAAVLGLVAIAAAGTAHKFPRELKAVKKATKQYRSVENAAPAGYVQMSPCEKTPAGGMGHHYVNGALMTDLATDPLRPEILLYAPNKKGKLRLVGVEYWVIALANTPTGPAPWFGPAPPPAGFFNPAPTLFGRTFDGPMEGHAPGMPWHYDLHAWIWKRNPTGVFAMWNPRVRCP